MSYGAYEAAKYCKKCGGLLRKVKVDASVYRHTTFLYLCPGCLTSERLKQLYEQYGVEL